MLWVNVNSEFVVSSSEVLDKGVSGTDHAGRAESFQSAHRPQPRLEPPVIGLNRIRGVGKEAVRRALSS